MDAERDARYPPGTHFGDYVIVRLLGEGTFGAVYEATHESSGARVALKVLHERLTRHPLVLQRFLREAGAIAALRHPFIVDAYEVGEFIGAPFLAMEYLEGETLAARLERERWLPVAEALAVVLPIVAALAALHAIGGVHRDVKPANIHLALQGGALVPKLLDFGIVKLSVQGEVLTRTAALLGTPAYMSPEQVKESKHVDGRADQWALGVVLYECLAGRRPFGGSTLLEQLNQVTSAPVRSLRAARPDVPPELDAVVMRCLQKRPDARFVTTRELGLALMPFAAPATQAQLWSFWEGDEVTSLWAGQQDEPTWGLFAAQQEVPEPGSSNESPSNVDPSVATQRPVAALPDAVGPESLPVRPDYGMSGGLVALARVVPVVMVSAVILFIVWFIRLGSRPISVRPMRNTPPTPIASPFTPP
jgi:serine/threonine-protein kinase